MTRLPAQADSRARRVLVVDDDDETRNAFVDCLVLAGFEVTDAWGAKQALRLMLATQADAVVLDMVLPDGHGIEVGRAMRAIVTTRRTCVVAVTSSASSVAFVDPASFGAEKILIKPVDPEVLVTAVTRWFAAVSSLARRASLRSLALHCSRDASHSSSRPMAG